jgi:hypothetical protein
MGLVLLAVAMLALIGCLPMWPYSRRWGLAPSAACAILLLVVLMLMLFGVLGPSLRTE